MTEQNEMIVFVVADYGNLHDLAFAEVTQKLIAELNDVNPRMHCYAVPAFDTYATGFVLGQLAINSKLGDQQKFYVNTAPRKDDLLPRVKNAGEGFAYIKLKNGIELCAVNSGYSISFIKDAAAEIRKINCSAEGSQFRSRDIFPQSFSKIAHKDYSELGEDIINHVPDVPDQVVCYTDGYGNMKTSITPSTLKELAGRDIVLHINGRTRVAKITDGIFGVSDGQLCLAPGSSGWTLPDGTRKGFAEIVLRGGSAAEVFERPIGGTEIKWDFVS